MYHTALLYLTAVLKYMHVLAANDQLIDTLQDVVLRQIRHPYLVLPVIFWRALVVLLSPHDAETSGRALASEGIQGSVSTADILSLLSLFTG